MSTRVRSHATFFIAVVGCSAAVGFGAKLTAAEEPTPTPSPAVTATAQRPATPVPTRKPIVITDENLQEFAEQGRLTTAEPGSSSATRGRPVRGGGSGADLSGLPIVEVPADDSEAEKRRYWRDTYQRQLRLVEQLGRQIEELDASIPGLWNKFYAWDDPAYRDGVIKPELDQAIARREHFEKQLELERERLPEIMDQARRDGAQPGWFRDLPSPAAALAKPDSGAR